MLSLPQALDALLKEVCNALLETDVNVKLVAQLRSKVKVKVKASLEGSGEKVKETNRKNVVQKVRAASSSHLARRAQVWTLGRL